MKVKNLIFKILYSFLGLIALFLVYSHYEYRNIKIKTIKIKSKDMPKEFDGKRILFVADFQYDTMARYNGREPGCHQGIPAQFSGPSHTRAAGARGGGRQSAYVSQ